MLINDFRLRFQFLNFKTLPLDLYPAPSLPLSLFFEVVIAFVLGLKDGLKTSVLYENAYTFNNGTMTNEHIAIIFGKDCVIVSKLHLSPEHSLQSTKVIPSELP